MKTAKRTYTILTVVILTLIAVQYGCNKSILNSNPPVVSFTANPTSGTVPLTVSFYDQSSNNPKIWVWDFGDGNSSTQQNPSHTYNNAGTYSVTLIATNSAGSNTKTQNNLIVVNSGGGSAPVSNFTATPTSGTAPLTVTFTDQSTNTSTSWQWNFGDGNTSTGKNPSHTYNSAGSYTVSLTATNNVGSDTKTESEYITVSNGGGGTGTFTDPRDGQTYVTVTIGSQIWFAENLKYLPSVSPSSEGLESSPYYYIYDYQGTDVSEAKSTTNYQTYGVLYNWPAATNACPSGWHLPSDEEWTALINYLGGDAGGKMKEAGTEHWNTPNTGATNSSGFTALPGGYRLYNGYFNELGGNGNWWSSTVYGSADAWSHNLFYDEAGLGHNIGTRSDGFSVRCLKD